MIELEKPNDYALQEKPTSLERDVQHASTRTTFASRSQLHRLCLSARQCQHMARGNTDHLPPSWITN